MDADDFSWLKNSKAFGLFVAELEERLKQLDELQKVKTVTDLKLIEQAKHNFHQTKGAAGMFGLDELANIAASLEHYFGANLQHVFCMNLESKALIEQFQRCVNDILEQKEK